MAATMEEGLFEAELSYGRELFFFAHTELCEQMRNGDDSLFAEDFV